jgi:hypothetical protein
MSLFKDVRKHMGIRESFITHQVQQTEEDVIRDMYVEGKIFTIGEEVTDTYTGVTGSIIRRGTNYVTFIAENGITYKKWLYELELAEDGPCWDTHKQVGMKKKNGKMVPNCVPKEEIELDEKIAGLVTKAEKSGMPYGILKKVYDRGMAAYKTGHRPGTTAQQWAFARVNSFTTKSSGTWGKADADLAAKVRGETYEIGTDEYKKHTRKVTPGQSATRESVEEWYLDENTRDKYEERFGDNWLVKLTETYNKMLSKLPCCDDCDGLYEHTIVESEYQGKKVKLNDPIRTSENPNKKFKVYVKNEKGKVVVVRFGDPNMSINRDDPKARKSFRARHGCDKDPGPKWKAKYWSCYQWRGGAKVDN